MNMNLLVVLVLDAVTFRILASSVVAILRDGLYIEPQPKTTT
jgi:hypothetical protein